MTATLDAKEFRITPESNLKLVVSQTDPGDTVVLANGEWRDAKLTFDQLAGTLQAPIHIRAETAGKVVLTGRSEFRFSGNYIVVSGLVFRDMQNVSDVVQLRTHSERLAHHCRITDCVFQEAPRLSSDFESRWLSIYGSKNRIDHCYFAGKKNRGTTVVVWVNEDGGEHRIDHNYFGHRPVLGRNGGETIRIGSSQTSELNCRTVVEDNYFHECDGEAEIISNKSCENVYRHNVFDACSGALTLRHGHRCTVDGNAFLGRSKRGTGGVRIIGENHTVMNNYFAGLRGDEARAAISMMNGVSDGPLSSYAPVKQAIVTHNTFIDCKVTFEIGIGNRKNQTTFPANCQITQNVFLPGKWPLFRVYSASADFIWNGNKHQQGRTHADAPIKFERVDLDFAQAADGLQRPTSTQGLSTESASTIKADFDGHPRIAGVLAGCDDPSTPHRQQPSPTNTGPTWNTGLFD